MRKAALLFVLLFTGYTSMAQDEVEIKLYKKIPGEIRSNNYVEKINTRANGTMWAEKISEPTLKFFRPEESVKTNTAVIICPGGGYAGLALSHEGYDVAKKFAELGVSAFVLKYRLPSDEIMKDRKIGPLQDAQQAIKYIRENASKYGIDVNKIGVMGFSAGGHLASTASTQFRRQVIDNKENTSLRPDFSILLYPVITFGEFTHKGSRKNLIGDHATQELIDLYSSEKQVTSETPITFIVHSNDDKAVPVENTLSYIQALNKAGVKNEAHIYAVGGHGYGMDSNRIKDVWFDRLVNWMRYQDILK
ncbi:alpha/beta hydrolase [Pseudoxanthomonas sp. SGD-10]|nr:alpha/beta hydrolase [Pseudoxanthomonas sp. SGD-10]